MGLFSNLQAQAMTAAGQPFPYSAFSYKDPPPAGTPSKYAGQGPSYLGIPLNSPMGWEDPSKGYSPELGGDAARYREWWFTEPVMAWQFLQESRQPGGYLSPEQTSLEAASAVRSLAAGGQQAYKASLDRLGATGLNPMYARERAGGILDQTRGAIGQTMVDARAEQIRRNYEAQLAWTNMAMQTSLAMKMARQNEAMMHYAARKGAKLGKLQAGAQLFGSGMQAAATGGLF